MIALFLLCCLAAVAGYLGVKTLRQRRTPPELRGDWWARFERDFRAYAARTPPRPRPPRQRRPHDRRRHDRRRAGPGSS